MEYFRMLTQMFYNSSNESNTDMDKLSGKLKSDPDSGNPNKAWRKRLGNQHYSFVVPLNPSIPVSEDYVRFVCISDTHTILEKSKAIEIPDGDVLLHAGDFSMYGRPDEVHIVNEYLASLPHKHKVIIAGNHDMTFDLDLMNYKRSSWAWSMMYRNYESELRFYGATGVHEMLKNCIYLQDSYVELYGIKIYGSPWTVSPFRSWGFQRARGDSILEIWNQIPDDTDVLITHTPPCGFGDNATGTYFSKAKKLLGFSEEEHCGCVDLLNTVQQRVKPKYHVFGHIHQGYGIRTDETTTFINASVCDENYDVVNAAIVFDVPIPAGYSKTKTNWQGTFLVIERPFKNRDMITNANLHGSIALCVKFRHSSLDRVPLGSIVEE